MIYKVKIGNTIFHINTPLEIQWRKEETDFFSHDIYENFIDINIKVVNNLPLINEKILYQNESLMIGLDQNDREIRTYIAAFMINKPVYAQSIIIDNHIIIYYLEKTRLWNNPNIRIWNFLHMEKILLDSDTLILHCSYMTHNNKAILFSAPSGTGKTTQAKLWEKNYHSTIINGDKCLLIKDKNMWYAYGYPFHGSADECVNEKYPICAIIVVRQSQKDYIEEISLGHQISSLYSEVTVNNWDSDSINKTIDLITDICTHVNVIKQHCTMKDTASTTLYNYLYGGEDNATL